MSIDWGTILGGVGNAATGGLLGLLGSLGSTFGTYYLNKAQFAHDEKMAELNMQADAARSKQKIEETTEAAAGEAFTKSQEVGNVFLNIASWAVSVLAMFRPALTSGLTAFVVYIYIHADTPEQRILITQNAITLASLSVGWWFGDRQVGKLTAARYNKS